MKTPFPAAVLEAAADICIIVLNDARLPVGRCMTPDTANAVRCMVAACWNNTGMDTEGTPECNAHVGSFAVPIIQTVRINAGIDGSIPAHVLVRVCDALIERHALNVARSRDPRLE